MPDDDDDDDDLDSPGTGFTGSDIPGVIDNLFGSIRNLTRSIANRYYAYPDQRTEWIECVKGLYSAAKKYARIEGNIRLCRDVPSLELARNYLQAIAAAETQTMTERP